MGSSPAWIVEEDGFVASTREEHMFIWRHLIDDRFEALPRAGTEAFRGFLWWGILMQRVFVGGQGSLSLRMGV